MMLISRLTALMLLTLLCWFGYNAPAFAQTLRASESIALSQTAEFAQFGGTPLFSFAGNRPTNLGVKQGQLLACPNTPNCVNSQSTDPKSQIAPLTFSGSLTETIARLKAVIEAQPRAKIMTEDSNYLYAEFTSALMGFVDDVEFYLDEAAGVIHVRSASRLGQSDLGVNRNRVETIRSQFTQP